MKKNNNKIRKKLGKKKQKKHNIKTVFVQHNKCYLPAKKSMFP